MLQRPTMLALGACAALLTPLAPLGCTQHYNGSLGIGSAERDAATAYQREKQEREAALVAPAPADPARASQMPGLVPASTQAAPAASAPAASTPSAAPSPAPRRAMNSMGLFGQLDPAFPGRSSPLDGAGDISQVTFTSEGADFDPNVDPTGKWLVYASTRHRETSDLYLKSVHGTAVTQLTSDAGNERMPAFSPDGSKLAFCSDRTGSWDIYLMDVRGGQAMQITNDAADNIHPSFSPDGRYLVYSSRGGWSGQWELVVVDVENPTTKRVIGHGLMPRWSPADNRIVFQRARQRGTLWFSIWTVTLTNGDVSPPTEIAVSSNAAVITPAWSPDGKHIVFCTVMNPPADEQAMPEKGDIWVVSADGSNRARLTQGAFANFQPVWAANDLIFFVSNRAPEGVENIWAMQAGQVRQMVEGSGRQQLGRGD